MTVGQSIRYHRKKLALTQAQLAQRLGVSVQAVSKWENDGGMPDSSLLAPLAQALGTTTDEILRFGVRRHELETRWKDALRTGGDDPQLLLQVSLEALKEFPYDWQFLYRAAVDEMRFSEFVEDPQQKAVYRGRAAAHARLSLEMDPDKRSAQWILERLQESGKTEKASG